jgi:hypothetical protein
LLTIRDSGRASVRTVISNVPTLAERSGVFRQNIYDPTTTVGNTRSSF